MVTFSMHCWTTKAGAGHQKNAEVKPKRLADNKAVIVFDPMSPYVHVGHVGRFSSVSIHLGPPDEARFALLLRVLTEDEFVIFDAMCERVRLRTDQGHLSSQHLSSRGSSVQAQPEHWTNPAQAHRCDDGLAAHSPSHSRGKGTKRKHSIGGWSFSQYQE